MTDLTCIALCCDRPAMVKAKQMCFKHYQRFMKTGSTDLPPKPPRICVVEDCGRELVGSTGRGMCSMHYGRFKMNGTTERRQRICEVDGCGRTWVAQKMCAMHYQRFVKTGTTEPSDHPHAGGREYRPPTPAEPRPPKPGVNAGYCKVEGCDKRPKTAGLCPMHASRVRRGEHAATMCRWCWEVFTPTLRGNQSFCSDQCVSEHRGEYGRGYQKTLRATDPGPDRVPAGTPQGFTPQCSFGSVQAERRVRA